jgi:4-hydroxybenzoate polyprenyltransferase
MRPFASGELPIGIGGLLLFGLLLGGFGLALMLPPLFVVILAIYTVMTVSYSMLFKSIPIVDVLALAMLYCTRILAGGAVIGEQIVSWLAVFSLLFFASLAFAKRHSELRQKRATDEASLAGRGYGVEDRMFVSSFGVALAVGSLLVFLLYAFSGQSQALSSMPIAMVCFGAISYWIMRIWFLTMRGQLDDDPVLFAVKDRTSMAMAAMIVAALLADQWLR